VPPQTVVSGHLSGCVYDELAVETARSRWGFVSGAIFVASSEREAYDA